jgi:uncharacterized protein (DUF1778 family)
MATQYHHKKVTSMTTHKKESVLNLRVSGDTKAMAKEIAEAQGRTITNLIEWLIREEHERLKEKRRG